MQTVDSDQTSGSNAAENKGMKLVYRGNLQGVGGGGGGALKFGKHF